MKSIANKLYITCLSAMLFIAPGCNHEEMLEENPRSQVTPDYFETAEGIRAGVFAGYAGFRYYYGTEGGLTLTAFGTDEFTDGRDGGSKGINRYNQDLNPGNGQFTGPWNRNYTYINTLNGVIEIGPDANIAEAQRDVLIAEAKYLRAHYYFILVQFFGDVTIDLGAGSWRFNTSPSTAQERAPREEVYEGIVQDLQDAIEDLPAEAYQRGRADQAAAMHLLAKVYLTRAGTLNQQEDYERAYQTAKELIDNRGTYGLELLQDFGDVHAQGNEDNSEIIWTVEHTTDQAFNTTPGRNGLDENRSIYLFRPLYENAAGLQRTIEYGRPWLRFKPTEWLFEGAFAEREIDSRYDNSFQTVWYANDPENLPEGMSLGDTALYMPGYEMPAAEQGAKPYEVITPSEYDQIYWPSLTKYDDRNRPDIMAASVRPFIVHKFSETYLIAAEAAYMTGRESEAAQYINVLRERAAYRPENSSTENAEAAAANRITAGDLSIDFILDERTRELVGEQTRWLDLVRTGKLLERVRLHNPQGAPNIQPHHVLRPIPQSQIDLTTVPYPQNPGY